MAGFFLMLPMFSLFTEGLSGSTPVLAGLAVGIYGLMQACLQVPLGMLSDHIGRKPVIIGGLVLFAVGSAIAALSDHIIWVIIGRAVQGCGAVAAAILALAADLTREQQRTKVMAGIGITIGAAFILSLVMAPVLHTWVGASGIFWLTAGLAIVAITLVTWVVPTPSINRVHQDIQPVPKLLKGVLQNAALIRLDIGIFALHFVLTTTFLALPIALRNVGLPLEEHAWVYLPLLVISLLGMAPFIRLSSRKKEWMQPVFAGAVAILCLAQIILWQGTTTLWLLLLGVGLFFTAFNLLEATLPSMVSKAAPAEAKGTALGVYTTAQFMGAFVGGVAGGWMHQLLDLSAIFLLGAVMVFGWWLILRFSRR
jgi:MFS family permease